MSQVGSDHSSGSSGNLFENENLFPFHDAAETGSVETLEHLLLARAKLRESLLTNDSSDEGSEDYHGEFSKKPIEGTHNGTPDFIQENEITENNGTVQRLAMNEKYPGNDALDQLLLKAHDFDYRDQNNSTALHVALLNRRLECAQLLIEHGACAQKTCEGSSLIHLAVAASSFEEGFSLRALRYLIEKTDIPLDTKDDRGQTILHMAAALNDLEVVSFCLSHPKAEVLIKMKEPCEMRRAIHIAVVRGHQEIVEKLVSASKQFKISISEKDIVGRSPLHLACYFKRWEIAKYLITEGLSVVTKDKYGLSSRDISSEVTEGHCSEIPDSLRAQLPNALHQIPRLMEDLNIEQTSAETSPTLIIHHESCEQHHTFKPTNRGAELPPENVNRLKVIYHCESGILRTKEFEKLQWLDTVRRAQIADILRVHEYTYVEKIRKLCKEINEEMFEIGRLDSDTAISHHSFEAAVRAAGAVIEAVDRVCGGLNRNAFCAIRPPGHHAGFRGKTVSENNKEGSHGFCLFNNAAIAAAYARSMYRTKGIQRIAIVDFDVHHGNGTQDCVQSLIPSVEVFPINPNPIFQGVIKKVKYQPWLNEGDKNNVLFISTHGYGKNKWHGGWFYPGSGPTSFIEDDISPDFSTAEDSYLTDISSFDDGTAKSLIINCGFPPKHLEDSPSQSRLNFRNTYREKILPKLAEFRPDLILISAGFDAHCKDTINDGHIGLREIDFYWITCQLVKIANTFCEGRIVSVLEGGYRIQGGIVSAFARSVGCHVRALLEACQTKHKWDPEISQREGEIEMEFYAESEMKRQQKKHLKAQNSRCHNQQDLDKLKPEQEIVARIGLVEPVLVDPQKMNECEIETTLKETAAGSQEIKPSQVEKEQTDDTSESRPKRKRVVVDYVALSQKMNEESSNSNLKT